VQETVGIISPLLALIACIVFFVGLDFDEDLACEAELMALVRRAAAGEELDDDDAASDDSHASLDSWSISELADELGTRPRLTQATHSHAIWRALFALTVTHWVCCRHEPHGRHHCSARALRATDSGLVADGQAQSVERGGLRRRHWH
jgi:hypothetical protein